MLEALQTLGRWPKRRKQPKGDAEIAENKLAIRLSKAFKKKEDGGDLEPGLEEVARAFVEAEPTLADQKMAAVRRFQMKQLRLPKRIKNPVGDAQIAENKLARALALAKKTIAREAEEHRQTKEDSAHSPSSEEDSVHGRSSVAASPERCRNEPSSAAAALVANNPARSQPKRALKLHHTV